MRITSILSLAGVLSAGSAAAAVNSQVLTDTESNTNAAVTAGAVITDSAAQVYSGTLAETQVMYQIGDAGLVTLDTAGNVLTVVSASASDGWEVIGSFEAALDGAANGALDGSADGQLDGAVDGQLDGAVDGAADVAVLFQKGDDVIQFTAALLADGTVATDVEPNPSGVLDANGTVDDEGTDGAGNGGDGNGTDGNGTDGNGTGDDTGNDSGVDDANGTADDDEADDCSGEFITVCVDADAETDVEVNDD